MPLHRTRIRLILILLLTALLIVFLLQNSAAVNVHFLTWTAVLSLSLLLLMVLLAGAVIGWLLYGYLHHRRRRPGARL